MKRFLFVFLSFHIAICLALSPASAAETATGFTDVSLEDWFAPYVEVCTKKEIMEGTSAGLFSPEGELTLGECRTLAYRLYDLQRGGNGELSSAPEDWGYLSLTVDGKTFEGYTDPNMEGGDIWGLRGHDDWRADGSDYPGYTLPAAFLSPEWAGWAWSVQDLPAVMAYRGKEYSGTASYGRINDSTVQISFLPDEGREVAELLTDVIFDFPPAPEFWWRDLAYTLESQNLKEYFNISPYVSWENPVSRTEFARLLDRAAGELEPVLSLSQLPDSKEESVLRLYRAGILSGTDSYGTFHGEWSLTRAEACAMAARILEPSLRLTVLPTPLPQEGYSLTYLMEDELDCGITYPVLLFGAADILLTLDGKQLPWPVEGGVPSYGINSSGDYLYLGYYDTDTENPYDLKAGLIDRSGNYIVPPENGRSMTYAVEGGFFSEVHRDSGTVWLLLDEQGKQVKELEQTDGDPREAYPPKARQPLRGIDFNGAYYVDSSGIPVSQPFNWGTHITPDGQGFVGIEGKIYRIQFETP